MLRNTGTRLSATLLGYVTLIILLLTLNPFYLALPERITFTFESDLYNLVSNIVLFLPLGFLYRLTARRRGAFLLGAAVSLGIEAIQLFVPARTPSVVDILANALGSGLGALGHDLFSARIRSTKSMVGSLRLETPLMMVIYLLGPLLWVNALRLRDGSERWILTWLVGLCGTLIFSQIFRNWWKTTSIQIAAYAAVTTGAWFLIGAGPAFRHPLPIVGIGLGLMSLTALLTVIPQSITDRRFERTALMRVFPVFGLYLLLLALWPPRRALTTWHLTLGFTNRVTESSTQVLYPRIEYLVAFTVLGYLLAEWRGRSEIPLSQDLPRLFLYSLVIAVTLEFLVGFQSGPGASLIRVVMVIISALFGGAIYHLLRAHVRFLLGR
jgi:glycopeptide antibiotics resistance protein